MNEKAETPQERPGWVFDFQVSGKGEDKATNEAEKLGQKRTGSQEIKAPQAVVGQAAAQMASHAILSLSQD